MLRQLRPVSDAAQRAVLVDDDGPELVEAPDRAEQVPRVAVAEAPAAEARVGARRGRRVHEPEQPRPAGALKRDLVPADSRALDDHHVQREDAAAVFEKGNREGIQVPEEEGNRDREKCHRERYRVYTSS